MLLRFVISNYLSFDANTEFNTFPFEGAGDKFAHHIYDTGKVKNLKSTAIYGSNNSGKSNMIDALETLQLWVKNGRINTSVNRSKFRIKDENQLKPVTFLIEFFTAGTYYIYGISVDDQEIIEEYLYESGIDKKPTQIFRHHENAIRLNTLRGVAPIDAAYHWITSELIIVRSNTSILDYLHKLSTNPAFFSFTNDLIKHLDVDIDYITLQKIKRTEFLANYDPGYKHPNLLTAPGQIFIADGKRYYTTQENDEIILNKITAFQLNKPFDLTEESRGTKRLFELIPIYWSMIHYPKTHVIDEIEISIHPALISSFVKKMLHNKETRGQLIFTTHCSDLFTSDIFRYDEIWFAEKNKETRHTSFYSLHDFRIPYNFDIRKGYQIGRFGANPFLVPFELLKH
jgi:AAA15 family ATPase/GTPase